MKETIQTFYNEISKSSCSLEKATEILETLNEKDPKHAIIIEKIIEKLLKEKEDIEKEYPEMIDYIEEINQKIKLCNQKIKPEKQETVKIVFGKTPARKVCFLSDLKDIDHERYSSIWKELQRFIDNGYHFDGWVEEQKVFKIKSHSKGKQERMYGYLLPGGYAYLIGIAIKKDDWSKGDRDFLKNRIDNIEEDYKNAQIIAKEGNIGTLLEENKAIYEEIRELIEPKEKKEINEYEEKDEPTPLQKLEQLVLQLDKENEQRHEILSKIAALKKVSITSEEAQALFDEKIKELIERMQSDEKKAKTK